MSKSTLSVTSGAEAVHASFPVRYESRRPFAEDGCRYDTVALDVGPDGLSTTAPAGDLADVRYVWLEFTLPDDEAAGRIRALGELGAREGTSQRVRFKHLFPDHRVRLERFLRSREALTRAA